MYIRQVFFRLGLSIEMSNYAKYYLRGWCLTQAPLTKKTLHGFKSGQVSQSGVSVAKWFSSHILPEGSCSHAMSLFTSLLAGP